jgi:uncharacterized protein
MKPEMRLLVASLAAGALFVPLFVRGGWGPLDFWWGMTGVNVLLFALAVILEKGYPARIYTDLRHKLPAKISWGVAAAAALYLVFWGGNLLSRWLLPGAGDAIGDVYALKEGASPLRVGLLMGFVFGPGEEFFWRGFLQHHLGARFGPRAGFLMATALYAGVHIGSGNPMLVLAALVCGLAWGWLYYRLGSITVNAVSHTLWDLAVFLVFPFQG